MNGEIPMKKKALLAVLLAMTLLLSSCALIVKDKEVDANTVILKMGDKEITKAEVQEAVDDKLYEMYQTYANYYGTQIDTTSPEVIAEAQSQAIKALKQDMVLRAKAAELGFDQLTEEETAQAKEEAQSDLEFAKSMIQSSYLTEEQKALEGEELEKAIQEKLDEFGVKIEDYEKAAVDTIVDDKLREYAIKDVTVSDDQVKADYDSKVAADEETYKENASSWASSANNGTTLYYTPAGIRRVKQILIKFKADDQTAVSDANSQVTAATNKVNADQQIIDDEAASEEDKTKAQEDLTAAQTELEAANKALTDATDAAYANIDADADAVLEQLKADPDSWDKLVEEKNEDPGMKAGATNAEKGYAVCEGMTSFDSAFVEAAMALKNVGDVSDKTRGASGGYYIIKYVGDDTEGPVDYDSVKEKIHSTLLTSLQNETYTATVEQWVEAAGIKEDLNALKD